MQCVGLAAHLAAHYQRVVCQWWWWQEIFTVESQQSTSGPKPNTNIRKLPLHSTREFTAITLYAVGKT